jgi:hypothetical protein
MLLLQLFTAPTCDLITPPSYSRTRPKTERQ